MNRHVRFDVFEIDTAAVELRRHGARIELAPAAVQTLLLLVERSGELVTRDELYGALWPNGGVDTKRLLNTYIKQIRAALGERPGEDKFIRTYPRRGYRFLRPTNDTADIAVGSSARLRAPIPMWNLLFATIVVGGVAAMAFQSRQGTHDEGETLPEHPDARIEYLTGVELLESPLPNIRASAAPHFRKTVELEPNYAPAFSGLAESLVWAGQTDAAGRAAARSLELDSMDARGHLTLGSTLLTGSWQWDRAERHFRTARHLSPDEASSGVALAFLLISTGRNAEARDVLDELVRMEPVSPVVTGDIGMLYGWLGEHPKALELCRRTTHIEPRATWGHSCALDAARTLGRADIVAFESASIVTMMGADTADVFTPFSNIEARIAELRRFQLSSSKEATSHFGAAMIWSEIGAVKNALDELELAATSREMGFVAILAAPSLRILHSEPRFERLVEQLFGRTVI